MDIALATGTERLQTTIVDPPSDHFRAVEVRNLVGLVDRLPSVNVMADDVVPDRVIFLPRGAKIEQVKATAAGRTGEQFVYEHHDPTFRPAKSGNAPASSTRQCSGSGGRKTRKKKKNIGGESDAGNASGTPDHAAEAERRAAQRREEERRAELGRYMNKTVVLVCVDQINDKNRVLLPTRDPYDSAHGKIESTPAGPMLVPNATLDSGKTIRAAGAVPRRYPSEQLNSRGVSLDSVFDETYEAQHRLDGIPGVGIQDNRLTVGGRLSLVIEGTVNRIGYEATRSIVRPRTSLALYRKDSK